MVFFRTQTRIWLRFNLGMDATHCRRGRMGADFISNLRMLNADFGQQSFQRRITDRQPRKEPIHCEETGQKEVADVFQG